MNDEYKHRYPRMYNVCDRRCRGQSRCNLPWMMNAIWKIKFIFILYSYSWRIAPVLTSTAPIAYVVRSWISMFLLSKTLHHRRRRHRFATKTCANRNNNIWFIPIILISILLLSPFLFLGLPALPPSHFLRVYERSWTGGRQIKILKLQEKKNALLVQLFMNDS